MLYKLFIVQWNSEVKGDWTTEAKMNMFEFALPQTLEFIGSKSKNVFKNLIKKKAREFEFRRLLEIKNCKSKLKNITYAEFKLQEYLELKTMTASMAKALFKFRVCMAPLEKITEGGIKLCSAPSASYTQMDKTKVLTVNK